MTVKTTVTTSGKGSKKTVTTTSSPKTTKGGKRRSRGARSGQTGSYNVLTGHYQMLTDPCNATLTESAYRGQAGIPARFVRSWAITTGTETAYSYIANPADTGAMENKVAASNTAFTPSVNAQMAGYYFLLNNATSWRVMGYCLQIDYLGSELTRAGKLYTGCIPSSTITAGVATSADSIKMLLPDSVRTPDTQVESKWIPGVTNEDYANRSNTSLVYSNSNNSIAFIAENMPAGLQLAFKETMIVEWIPQAGLGFAVPAANSGTNPPAAYEQLHNATKRDPSFIHGFSQSAKHELSVMGNMAGKYAVRAGMQGLAYLGKQAYKAAPLLLTM